MKRHENVFKLEVNNYKETRHIDNKPNTAAALIDAQINILHEINLGLSNNEALLNTLWLFKIWSARLRRTPTNGLGNVKLMTAADGIEYLEYQKRQTKTRTSAETRNVIYVTIVLIKFKG